MPLPEIPVEQPIVIPPVSEKIYDKGYIVRFNLHTTDVGGNVQPITIDTRKCIYKPENGIFELFPTNTYDESFFFQNVWVLAAQHPLIAQVMGGLVYACSLLIRKELLERQLSQLIERGVSEDMDQTQIDEINLYNENIRTQRDSVNTAVETVNTLLNTAM